MMDAVRRLHPEPASSIDVVDAYAAPLGAHPDRPWVNLCMISSLDGATAVDGRSRGLSSANDASVLRQLRAIADVIIVGATTARAEGYGPPSKEGQRIGVVTARGSIDVESPLFTSGRGFVITHASADFEVPVGVDVIRAGERRVDVALAIRAIPTVVPDCRFVQAEGGPTLNAALFAADLVDEIDQSTSPHTVGGPSVGTGAPGHRHAYELRQLLIDADAYVYARWARRR